MHVDIADTTVIDMAMDVYGIAQGLRIAKWVLIFLPLASLYSQDLSPSLTMSGAFYPSRELKDTVGSYAHQQVMIGYNTTLFKKIEPTDNGLKFYLLSFAASTLLDRTNLTFLPVHRNLFNINVSLGGIYRAGSKSVWLSKVAATALEDEETIRHLSFLRMSGFVFYKRLARENFFYLVGAAYNFSYGSGVPFPVLGVGWNFENKSSLSVILPMSISYHFGKALNQYTIFIRPNGGISNFYNSSFYPNAAEKIVFRRREFAIGIKKRFKLSNQWSLFAEAGLLTGRKVFFSRDFSRDEPSNLFEGRVYSGPYMSVGLKYKLKKLDAPGLLDVRSSQVDVD